MFITSRFSNRHLEIICVLICYLFMHSLGVTQLPESLVLANSLYFKNSPTITLSCAIVLRSSVLQMSTKLLLKRLVARLWYACSMGDNESLESLRYKFLCKKVAIASTFVKPGKLPPTSLATKFHARRTYLQVMEWMGMDDGMDFTEWGWDLQGNQLVPLIMENSPAPDPLLKMIRCNCLSASRTLKCNCKKHDLECTTACGRCQYEMICDNISQEPFSDNDDEI